MYTYVCGMVCMWMSEGSIAVLLEGFSLFYLFCTLIFFSPLSSNLKLKGLHRNRLIRSSLHPRLVPLCSDLSPFLDKVQYLRFLKVFSNLIHLSRCHWWLRWVLQVPRASSELLDPRDKWDHKALHCIKEVGDHKDSWDHKDPRALPRDCLGLKTCTVPKECRGTLDLMALWVPKGHPDLKVVLVLKVIWVPRVHLDHRVTLAPKVHLLLRATWARRGLLVLKECRDHLVPEECKDLLILMGYRVDQGLKESKVQCLRDL